METETKIQNKGFALHPEIEQGLTAFLSKHPPAAVPARGDWKALKESSDTFYVNLNQYIPHRDDVQRCDYTCTSNDGAEIRLRWYHKAKIHLGSAIVYVHGGGRIAGSVDLYDAIVANYVHQSGVPFLSVDYRMPPEGKDESLAEDVFAAILWLQENAERLSVDTDRIAIMGDSGGGGIAASAAILARDRGIALAKQILLYPMLDDRTIVPDEQLVPFAVWNYDSNYTGWMASMTQEPGSTDVSPLIAAARLSDYKGLAPAYISIGVLDIFRDESMAYAQRLLNAGVPVELHLYPGAPHAFDFLAPNAAPSKSAVVNLVAAIQSL